MKIPRLPAEWASDPGTRLTYILFSIMAAVVLVVLVPLAGYKHGIISVEMFTALLGLVVMTLAALFWRGER